MSDDDAHTPLDDLPGLDGSDAGAMGAAADAPPGDADGAAMPGTDSEPDDAPPLFARPVPGPDAPPTPPDPGVQTLRADDGSVLRVVPVTSEPLWSLARSIRQRVFVEEQRCPPAEEWDVYDEWEAPGSARHLVLFAGGSPAATARWRVVGAGTDAAAKLERIAVLPTHRGKGLGRSLVGALVAMADAAGHRRLVLSAQRHLEGFYGSFGFARRGDDFWEAGIPHVPMARGDA